MDVGWRGREARWLQRRAIDRGGNRHHQRRAAGCAVDQPIGTQLLDQLRRKAKANRLSAVRGDEILRPDTDLTTALAKTSMPSARARSAAGDSLRTSMTAAQRTPALASA